MGVRGAFFLAVEAHPKYPPFGRSFGSVLSVWLWGIFLLTILCFISFFVLTGCMKDSSDFFLNVFFFLLFLNNSATTQESKGY